MAMKTYLISSNQANYTDAEFSVIQTLMLASGVFDDDGTFTGFEVTENAPQNLSVDVLAGNFLIPYLKSGVTWQVVVNSPSTENLTIAANNSGSNRVDAVVLHLTQSEPNSLKNNVAELRVITGTGISALSDGDIDTELGDSNWKRLANVTVPNADSTIENANIADTRTRISFDNRLQDIYARQIKESVSGEGVDVDNVRVNDDALDFEERGGVPTTPSTGRWKFYFKSSGAYIIDDAGNEIKIATGGLTLDRKTPAAAAAGEAFENSEDNTLAFKDNQDAAVNIGPGGTYGETITKGQAVGWLGLIDKGVTQYAPSHDTMVSQGAPAVNYDGNTNIQTSSNGGTIRYCLFKFANLISDLGINASAIHQIHSFTFNVYRTAAGGANSAELFPITSSWDSASVTWNTIPTWMDNVGLVTPVVSSATGYIAFNSAAGLNAITSKWILDNGMLLKTISTPVHSWNVLGSANPPYLTNLVYTGVDGKLHVIKGTNGPLTAGFMGIAPMDGVLNDNHAIVGKGSIFHATGTPYTPGNTYYVDDSGNISATHGTFAKEIGQAISNNQLFIKEGPSYLGQISVSPAGALPQNATIPVPEGCNMITIRCQTPTDTSRSNVAMGTILKGQNYAAVERYESGVWLSTTVNWSGDNVQVSWNETGAGSGGYCVLHFHKI